MEISISALTAPGALMPTAIFLSSGKVSDLPISGPPQAVAAASARNRLRIFLFIAIPSDVFRSTGNQAESTAAGDHGSRGLLRICCRHPPSALISLAPSAASGAASCGLYKNGTYLVQE